MPNSKLANPEKSPPNNSEMSNGESNDVSNETLLGLWLDDDLNEKQRQEFEQRCISDLSFSQQVETANVLNMQANSYQDSAVPNWDRAASFTQTEKPKWWQWQGLPSLSLAMSVFAVVMVLTGVNIKVKDGAMAVSLSNQTNMQEIDRLVASKLAEYTNHQQQVLNEYALSMQQQQLDTSTQLTEYLLTASRQERREDFAELIKYVNEQRSDDQNFYARQLNKLQQDIYATPEPLSVGNIK
ncbi:hypothetical protein L0668_09155 [Paraglaciecola aquimarina]|uniref:Anti-sigma factor n=1 Tax=Paraglaciecola algarum TaxID=3050085 RepID=A0ABS9D5R7_9ALTE|nr:hypothetical protein [Paraglaciecola sp. G1-23]MCF2948271.1 hypothetical protein [Paraglaciecola sp. G1-23]